MRDQEINLLKELQENLIKFPTLLIALIAATKSDTEKSLVLIIVLYSFSVIIGTIIQLYNKSLLPIITCVMLVLGSSASVLAVSMISSIVAWITLALWVGMFTLVAYDYAVLERIKNWIKGRFAQSSGLRVRVPTSLEKAGHHY